MYIAKSFRSNGFPITIECRKVPRMSVESKEWHKPAQSCLKSLTQGLQGDLRAGSIASGLKMNISFLAPVITLLGCQVLEDNNSGWMTHGKPFAFGSLLQGKLDDYTEWPHWPTRSLPLLTHVFFFSLFEFYFAVSSRLSKSISS
jgi:hypothetical protein